MFVVDAPEKQKKQWFLSNFFPSLGNFPGEGKIFLFSL